MTQCDVDLLPDAVRERVWRARGFVYATRMALGLVVVGTTAVALAEVARIDAYDRLERTRMSADATWAAENARDRLDANARARRAERLADAQRIPLLAVIAAVTETLPDDAWVAHVRFSEFATGLEAQFELEHADAAATASALGSLRPWISVAVITPSTIRVLVPRDRPFEVASEADGTAP